MAHFKRARPLLGTLVSIGIGGTSRARAYRAIDAGFAAIAEIHALMSFHQGDSDVTCLNCGAVDRPVVVDARTMLVVRQALDFSAASSGAFDITVAAQLVEEGFLPRPRSRHDADRRASWRDIELMAGNRIRFHRPLWIDLGGIAKGYAVDHALARMVLGPQIQVSVDAGGDLKVCGPDAQSIRLRVAPTDGLVPMVQLQDGSLASSSGREASRIHGRRRVGPHVHGVRRSSMGLRSFVSVVAPQCIVADALTKVVLARGKRCERLLRRLGATAYMHNARDGWRVLGNSA